MNDIKYCVEFDIVTYFEGVANHMFKQKFIGTEEDLKDLKSIVDSVKKNNIKARIIDFPNLNEIYKNYTSLIY